MRIRIPLLLAAALAAWGQTVAPAPIPTNLPPAERSWRNLKADYDRLEGINETAAKKYRMRVNVLEDKRVSLGEAAFVKEAGTLDEQIRVDLAKESQ